MMKNPAGTSSELKGSYPSKLNSRTQSFSYFIVTVLGFSFWFFMVMPFASHRESYSWLAGVRTQDMAQQLSFGVSSTYRPLAQIVTWLLFLVLDPRVFPTSVLRQALLQGLIYGMFVLAWWLIYSAVPQRRLFALVAFVAGGVMFSGYVHLFHIYGMMYVPVMLTLGALLHSDASGTFHKREVWFAVVAIVLVLWHPFATALFVGFYFGFYLDTFWQRSRAQHVRAAGILVVGMMAIAAAVVLFPRTQMSHDTRLLGFLASYQTNEVNWFVSAVTFVITCMVMLSMGLSPRMKFAAVLFVSALSLVCLLENLPVLLLWLCAVLMKLFRLRRWRLFFLVLTAALFPFGGATGTPIHALFAVVVAVYVTSLGWFKAEKALSFVKTRYVIGTIIASVIVLLMVRVGIEVPIVTRVANPLLAERERTYQLESILAQLHKSDYCDYEIAFVENAIRRQNRPPAALQDVQVFWDSVLRCRETRRPNIKAGTAIVTFGGPVLANSRPVFEVPGRYGGDATVWIRDSQR